MIMQFKSSFQRIEYFRILQNFSLHEMKWRIDQLMCRIDWNLEMTPHIQRRIIMSLIEVWLGIVLVRAYRYLKGYDRKVHPMKKEIAQILNKKMKKVWMRFHLRIALNFKGHHKLKLQITLINGLSKRMESIRY